MGVLKAYRIHGADGHRLMESFDKSYVCRDCRDIKYTVLNSDVAGTNDFAIVLAKGETEEKCDAAIKVQLGDGIFEDSRCGKVVGTIIEEW